MFDEHNEDSGGGYWPSISDLFMTLFIVALAIVMCVLYVNRLAKSDGDVKVPQPGKGPIERSEVIKPVNNIRNEALKQNNDLSEDDITNDIVNGLNKTSDEVIVRVKELEDLVELLTPEDSPEGPLIKQNEDLRQKLRDALEKLDLAEKMIKEKDEMIVQLNEKIVNLNKEITDLEAQLESASEPDEAPPIFTISSKDKDYRFASGSAQLNEIFITKLKRDAFKNLAAIIEKRNQNLKTSVDTIEIIGHTDGDPVSDDGNLDEKLPKFLAGIEKNVNALEAGSNNDLGLLRALAISQAWKAYVLKQDNRITLNKIDIKCYSAGQTQPPFDDDPELNPNDWKTYKLENQNFRRIEIRLTRRKF